MKIDTKDISIVLIADRTFKSCLASDINGDELEMISDEYYQDIYKGLQSICKKVTHYQSPEEFIDNIEKHKEDVVFTVYGGSKSRNRMALVPGVRESYNVKFAGADVYARVVCQDKFLSKEFAKRFNVESPPGVLVDGALNKELIEELKLPLVIKPNFEGSSIGINESCKVNSYEEAFSKITTLKKDYSSILVEEFVPGSEVCICIVGCNGNIKLFEAMEVYFENDEGFFHDKLYSAETKHQSERDIKHRSITHLLSKQQIEDIKKLYFGLGKMDYMRIDGRIKENKFTLIELTPDGYMGKDSSFCDAAIINNLLYEDLLQTLIHTALESYHTPYSNYKGS